MGFLGYKREDGTAGIRNHVVVMSSVSCANGVANAISRELPQVKAIVHTEGCGRGLRDIAISTRTLAGLGKNPNVAAMLVAGLGCEFIKAPGLVEQIKAAGKPAQCLIIQDEGGTVKTTQKGIDICKKFLEDAAQIKREECGWDKLLLALECGGSDALSGVTANPVIGVAADWLVSQGGTVMLAETTEMIGTEKILTRRAENPALAEKIITLIEKQEKLTKEILGPLAGMVISPGNIEGGLSTIQEKALGCIIKAGDSPIREVLDYSATPSKKGLVVMDTPGSDIFQLTGMAASGAQITVFSTGRGTPAGFPIMPVVKISSNSELFQKMGDDIDLDAGVVLSGKSIAEAGNDLVELIKQVVNGKLTKAEINKQEMVAIHTVGPAF
jgi:altronate dehydratase large subunit